MLLSIDGRTPSDIHEGSVKVQPSQDLRRMCIHLINLLTAGMAAAQVTNFLAWNSPGQQAAAPNSQGASPRGLGCTGGKSANGSSEALMASPFAEMKVS